MRISLKVPKARTGRFMEFKLSESIYRDLFQNAYDAMWVQDLDGNFVVVNEACERLTGYPRKELLTKNVKNFLVGDSLALARGLGHRLVKGESFAQPYEQRVVTKDGDTRFLKMTTSLVVVDDKPVGFQHVARDVTEEKSMSDILSEIIDGSPIPTFVIDNQHIITHWNTALESLTCLPAKEMLGTNLPWKAFYSKERPTLADMIVDGASPSEIEVYYQGKFKTSTLIEGAYEAEDYRPSVGNVGRWLHFTASPIRDTNGETVAALEALQDITEEKRMQDSMHYYVQLITRAQEEERKRLARDLHDDLSSSLLLLIRRLDAAIPTSKAKHLAAYKETMETLHEQAVEALEHVRRYVQDLRPRILDDLGLIASLEWMSDDMQRSYEIPTALSVSGAERAIPAEVQLLLFRIAQEALSNIRRHAQATQATVKLDMGEHRISLEVTDNGRGFQVPEQIEDLASAGRLGIMGMAERARLLNGNLEVVSSPGKGTKVSTSIPA